MAKISLKTAALSPEGICLGYVLASFLGILGFRFIFPLEAAPLPVYSGHWRFVLALEEFIRLFPALSLSALVIPFGFRDSSGLSFTSFSLHFSEIFRDHIITAIGATMVYGLLFLLALPLAQRDEADQRFQGLLFREAREKARAYAAEQSWVEAAQFVAVCENIWPESPEMETLKRDVYINLDEYNFLHSGGASAERADPALKGGEGFTLGSRNPQDRNPVDAAEALNLAETAFQEERYYDAHWLASLAGRIARGGSVEAAASARLASRAWNAVASLEPHSREAQAYSRYHLKVSGYEAMMAGDWIRGYYIFNEYAELNPGDPDVVNFIRLCEQGIGEIAFFIDEMELAVGEILTGAVFSLPHKTASGIIDGRVVMRFRSLSAFADNSYAIEAELIAFDREGQLLYRLEAPYVKIVPITLGAVPRVVLLMRALDRHNREQRWEPQWSGPEPSGLGNTQLILDISYEDFLLLSRVRRGTDNFLLGDLFDAEKRLGDLGYIPQVFQALIIRRFAEPVLFLSMAVLAIVVGWRYRAKKRPRYLGLPLLFLLPLVLNGVVNLYRGMINSLSILMALSLDLSMIIPVFIAISVVLFFGALILLAAQHG
jgi:hypothetical protein